MFILYMLEECPFCRKVMKHLEEKNIPYKAMDIKDPVNLDELLVLGGEHQVPFLVDTEHNVKMYESEEIIKYLDSL